MNKIIIFGIMCLFASCQQKKEHIVINNSEKNAQIEKSTTYISPNKNEITIIDQDCAVFVSPDSTQIAKLKGKTEKEEEEFYVAAEDNNYYQYMASQFLDSIKIKTIYLKTRYVKFINKNKPIFFDTKSKDSNSWMVILSIGTKNPQSIDFVSFEDAYKEYIK